eukprot:1874781-Prorocentrum_lima.AAC.1
MQEARTRTVREAEDYALYQALLICKGPAVVHVDCAGIVQAANSTQPQDHAHWWKAIRELMSEKNFKVVRIKAHQDQEVVAHLPLEL